MSKWSQVTMVAHQHWWRRRYHLPLHLRPSSLFALVLAEPSYGPGLEIESGTRPLVQFSGGEAFTSLP